MFLFNMSFFWKQIPNAITSANLFCGCLSIASIASGDLPEASAWICMAAILDFFDGFAARLLNAFSIIGKDLDSLADVISFGVAPGYMLFTIIGAYTGFEYIAHVGFLIPVFSAIRLAKFNNDPKQATDFKGLPTPANALFLACLPMIQLQDPEAWFHLMLQPLTYVVLTLFLSFLLISPIHLFSMKLKGFSLHKYVFRLLFLIFSLVLALIFKWQSAPMVLLLYVILSQFDQKRQSLNLSNS
jgi:CDP-diacylglycerol--serine O-phosphatidyltransferase